jgi:hypothetical protein
MNLTTFFSLRTRAYGYTTRITSFLFDINCRYSWNLLAYGKSQRHPIPN